MDILKCPISKKLPNIFLEIFALLKIYIKKYNRVILL